MEVGVPVKEDAGGKRAAPSGAAAPCCSATGAVLPTPFRCRGTAVAFSSDAAAAAFRSRADAAPSAHEPTPRPSAPAPRCPSAPVLPPPLANLTLLPPLALLDASCLDGWVAALV
ncbi:hypothetical protein E2562_022908 [Oryza meyeriana var. granulata]|uniref:Uncharacterized protein n=1 Tax=Oryza meyeriana var. granulata TaxID=110450 RepID=A0A6G1D6R3_9ORYZ|nr:hypothetical protein E2562_022908 [Oryza meyeriana var. granulata]